MNRRQRYWLNLACFALLVLALYLNFVRKDTDGVLPPLQSTTNSQQPGTTAVSSAMAPTTSTAAR